MNAPGRRTLLSMAGVLLLSLMQAHAAGHSGTVLFNDLPVPSAAIIATRGGATVSAITNLHGAYSFPALADGVWIFSIEMTGFLSIRQELDVQPGHAGSVWNLSMLPFAGMKAEKVKPALPEVMPAVKQVDAGKPMEIANAVTQKNGGASTLQADGSAGNESSGAFAGLMPGQLSERASDGFLINGSVNNAASSPYALRSAFGNYRFMRSQYNGSLNIGLNNSAFDARPFSLTGQNTPKPDSSRLQTSFTVSGPFKLPFSSGNRANFFANYQRVRDRKAAVEAGRMPTLAERNGDLSQVRVNNQAIKIWDPETSVFFENSMIPQSRISPQARSLLALFPLPNIHNDGRYNYQAPVAGENHSDAVNGRIMAGRIAGSIGRKISRSDSSNLFGFLDKGRVSSLDISVQYAIDIGKSAGLNFQYQFGRTVSKTEPYFAGRSNISGNSGITGNNQEMKNWGPPNLLFSNFTPLAEGQRAFDRDQSHSISMTGNLIRSNHTIVMGMDMRRQQLNLFSQQNARGAFTFTGAAAGYDFAGFLLGVPDAAAISFGNADKYFRSSSYAVYLNDDWRINSKLTLNSGIRWEYEAPFTELKNRLANLDVASGFTAVEQVLAYNPMGLLTGRRFSSSLIDPDKSGIQPRIGFAWRPWTASSLIVRGGYGIYRQTSLYLPLARRMSQQAPFSKNINVGNTPLAPLTLADGFNSSSSAAALTFGIDPRFRVGFAQNWQLSVQQDLPFSMQATAAYMGARGSRLAQSFYPNTYPAGAVRCASCPSGFLYVISNGSSIRHAGDIQLRRRLGNGWLANIQYTFSKSLDDASLGAEQAAQNWRDLKAERALSNFDQRHLLKIRAQYASGAGIFTPGLQGVKGAILRDWTIAGDLTIGSGLPLTPVYAAVMPGTGISGILRPGLSGIESGAPPKGLFLNPAAYMSPESGAWGNAGRNSITGPRQFSLNASLGRAFRMRDRYNIEVRLSSSNILNHANAASWNTTANSSLFGLPDRFNPMRRVQANLRVSF